MRRTPPGDAYPCYPCHGTRRCALTRRPTGSSCGRLPLGDDGLPTPRDTGCVPTAQPLAAPAALPYPPTPSPLARPSFGLSSTVPAARRPLPAATRRTTAWPARRDDSWNPGPATKPVRLRGKASLKRDARHASPVSTEGGGGVGSALVSVLHWARPGGRRAGRCLLLLMCCCLLVLCFCSAHPARVGFLLLPFC